MRQLNYVALILTIIGGLNWLLVGLFQFDLVAAIFGGQNAALARVVYILVGLAAIYSLSLLRFIGLGTRTDTAYAGNRPLRR